jgi:hypothetical protein
MLIEVLDIAAQLGARALGQSVADVAPRLPRRVPMGNARRASMA